MPSAARSNELRRRMPQKPRSREVRSFPRILARQQRDDENERNRKTDQPKQNITHGYLLGRLV